MLFLPHDFNDFFLSICVIPNLWWQLEPTTVKQSAKKAACLPFFFFTEFNIIELNRNKGCASYSMGWLHY